MPDKRKAYAPFSLITESGVSNAPVEGYIDVNQEIQPTVTTGSVNENGVWTGVKSSDTEFFAFTKHVAVANGGATLNPDTGNINHIDMTGFNSIFFAIKPTNGGDYLIRAVMGPDTERFANLEPINPGSLLKFSNNNRVSDTSLEKVLNDAAESCTADVWNIFQIQDRCAEQKVLQLEIVNNSGGESTIETAFMRSV